MAMSEIKNIFSHISLDMDTLAFLGDKRDVDTALENNNNVTEWLFIQRIPSVQLYTLTCLLRQLQKSGKQQGVLNMPLLLQLQFS